MAGTRPLPPHGVARCAVSGKMPGGGNWANTFWIQVGDPAAPSALSDAEVLQIADQLGSDYLAHIAPLIAADVTITLYQAIYYQPDGTATAQGEVEAHAGTHAGTTMADQVASCLSWVIAAAYRGGKPRTYVPGVETGDLLDPAHLSAANVTARQAAGAAFLAAVNAHTVGGAALPQKLGTVSFFTLNAPRAVGIFRPYTNVKVHNRLDTMRRRLGREL
jgi:hypothetical protein